MKQYISYIIIFFVIIFSECLFGAPIDKNSLGNFAKEPEVWMCVTPSPDFDKTFSLLNSSQDWSYVRTHITGIKFYIGMISKKSKEDLSRMADMCKKNNLKVAIECGGPLTPLWGDMAGEKSAKIELNVIEKWYEAGGTVDYLDLDGPVRRLIDLNNDCIRNDSNCFTSITRCADELVDYMKAVVKRHPKLRFFLLTNFPNWGYKGGIAYHGTGPNRQQLGDYDKVVKRVLAKVKAAGLSFDGVTVDNPYEYIIGEHKSATLKDPSRLNWLKRVRTYEDFCNDQGIKFNLIINSETGGGTSDKEFYERTLKMLETYIKAGGNPARYIVQSWYSFPKKIVPENKPYSMTHLVKAVLKRLNVQNKKTYTNPVIEEIGPADPTVIFLDGKYYMYPTGDSKNYYVYTSTDLVNWKKGGIVFHHKDGGLWAPDIYVCQEDGKFYLYYTSKMRVGVAVADSPLGPFQDKGILVEDAIDGHLFRDDDGKLYLYYVKQPGFRITVQKMKSPLKKSNSKPKQIIHPTEPWEKIQGSVTEGPWMLKHNNKYYLLYSGTGASTLNYAIGYATAKRPMGPFKKYSGNPIVKRGNGVLGPGHGCVVKDNANKLWSVYHQQQDGSQEWNRFICIDPLWFDDKGILHGKATRGIPQPAPESKPQSPFEGEDRRMPVGGR